MTTPDLSAPLTAIRDAAKVCRHVQRDLERVRAMTKDDRSPVTIADYAGQSAQNGAASYLLFLALISISLGVLNLLPIPLLDGGHLMYYVIEILKGRPISERAMEIGQHVGMALLFTLMAFALYNDITRLLVNG